MKILKLTAIAILLSSVLNAQSDSIPIIATIPLPEVEFVSEKRLEGTGFSLQSRNATIITEEMIKQLPVTTVHEVLQYVSGVDLRQRGPMGAQADITIMGSTFEQVLILVNGIPMRDPQTGHNQMNLPVSLNQIARIEVMMGSASRIYGANAMAGAVNIITKSPGEETVFVQAFAGSNFENDTASGKQYYLSGGQASLGFKTAKTGHQLDVSFIETNGYRYNSQNSQQRINYTGRIGIGKGKMDVFAGTIFNDFGANNFYAAPGDKNATESVNTAFGGIKYEQTIESWTLRPIVYTRYNHDDYIYIKQKPEVYRNNHYTTASGAEVHARQANRLGALGLGFESRLEMINSNNLGKHERYFYAAYAEQRFEIGEKRQLTIGANAQYNNDYGWRFYPGLEYNSSLWKFKTVRWYLNIGVSNRLPTYTDLYYIGPGNIGNALLKPERAGTAELGATWKKNNWFVQANASTRIVADYIDFARDSVATPWQPQNFGEATFNCGNVKVQYIFNKSDRFFHFNSISYSATSIVSEFDSKGLESKYIMDHLSYQLVANINFSTSKYFSHSTSARYAERMTGAQYAVFDYRLRYNHINFSAFVDITNIFDRKYIESGIVEMPGRWYRIGVEFKLPTRNK